jgi:hypothetical protein
LSKIFYYFSSKFIGAQVAAHETANNKLVNVEHMPEEELKNIQKDYFRIGE